MLTIDDIAITLERIGERINFAEVFGRSAPCELEIGCGKGAFLLRQARQHPERNYLGIEWANEFFWHSADRMARWGITNVRILRTDAGMFIRHRVPAESLAVLHIYHPDPWPKKRHHKRRLFNAGFVEAAAAALVRGGRLSIQTDHAEYFEVIRALTLGHARLTPTAFENEQAGTAGERTETNYERKYESEGRPIYRLAFLRTG